MSSGVRRVVGIIALALLAQVSAQDARMGTGPVREFTRKKKPRKFRDYGISFSLYDDADRPKSGIFKNDIAEIPFFTDIPKSMDEKTSVEGFVLIRLKDVATLEVIPNRS